MPAARFLAAVSFRQGRTYHDPVLDVLAWSAWRRRRQAPAPGIRSDHTVVMRPSPPAGYWAAVTTPPRGPVR
jgi:hypothetical protein